MLNRRNKKSDHCLDIRPNRLWATNTKNYADAISAIYTSELWYWTWYIVLETFERLECQYLWNGGWGSDGRAGPMPRRWGGRAVPAGDIDAVLFRRATGRVCRVTCSSRKVGGSSYLRVAREHAQGATSVAMWAGSGQLACRAMGRRWPLDGQVMAAIC
jgi:hypothetical protein